MTRKRQPLARNRLLREVTQPLEIFDAALDLLSRVERASPRALTGDAQLPKLALPSLLERCESMVAQAEETLTHRLLICVDGLGPLSPDWWRSYAGGIGVQRVSSRIDVEMQAGQRRDFARRERRQGRHALSVATLDDALPVLRSFAVVRLVTWHPWASFVAAPRAITLEGHCRAMALLLDKLDGVAMLKIEDLGAMPVDQASAIAASFGLTLPRRRQASASSPKFLVPPAEISNVIAYQQLCARLNYAPDSVPLVRQSLPQRSLPTLDELDRRPSVDDVVSPALVSWFLPRLAALGVPAAHRVPAALQEIVDALDSVLGSSDPTHFLESLIMRSAPETAALTLVLASAHYLRCDAKQAALALIVRALDVSTSPYDWVRMSMSSMLAEMGYSEEAILVAADPLLRGTVSSGSVKQTLLSLLDADEHSPPQGDARTVALPSVADLLRRRTFLPPLKEAPYAFNKEELPQQPLIVACHHKSGTNFLRRCFQDIADGSGLRIWFKFYDRNPGNSDWDICFHQHSQIEETIFSVPDFRGIHCIRHPMSLIYSAALYHEKCSEPWVDVPIRTFTSNSFAALTDRDTYNLIKDPKTPVTERAALMQVDAAAQERGANYVADFDFAGRTYRQMLRAMSHTGDKLKFEMSCFSNGVVKDMVRFPRDERFHTISLEEISHDSEMRALISMFRHLGFKGVNLEACLQRAAVHCLWNQTELPRHATTGVSDGWRLHFNGDIETKYHALFGRPEIALGYRDQRYS